MVQRGDHQRVGPLTREQGVGTDPVLAVAGEGHDQLGVIAPGARDGALTEVTGLVEKPSVADAPSNLIISGRYILQPEVMRVLEGQEKGAGGEIQLTDAIAQETKKPGNVFGLRFRGQRYDCGSKIGFLQATVAFGLSRPEFGEEFADFLHALTAMQKAAQ